MVVLDAMPIFKLQEPKTVLLHIQLRISRKALECHW